MRTLIVATNLTPPCAIDEIKAGQRHRIDYIELSQRFDNDYVDYNRLPNSRLLRRVEQTLRIDIRQARLVAQMVHQKHYDVVFSMSERVAIPLSYLLPRQVKQVVLLWHALSPKKFQMLKKLGVAQRWQQMWVITRAEATALQNLLSLEADRIQFLPYAVDTKFYKPIETAKTEEAADYIMSVGLSYRDYPTLTRAMQTLPATRCHIYAASSWVNNPEGLAGETIPPNVELKAYVPPLLLRERYQASRFVVMPIRPITQWSAGMTAVLEAQAMGKAVIATATPGMSDYVRDGETGLLVEENNPTAMAAAIKDLWDNPEKAAAMGRRAREWVAANFSLEQWLENVNTKLSDLSELKYEASNLRSISYHR